MWADFAFVLIRRANELYADEPLGLNFARRCQMHQAGAFFVTRANSNSTAKRVYSANLNQAKGVVCDQSVAFNGFLRFSATIP